MNYSLISNKSAILIAIALLNLIGGLYSQSDGDDHRKYWYYKSRLNNDFMKVGLGAGESLPSEAKRKNDGAFASDVNSTVYWGDATSYLGYYIAILATEYKLLATNSQDTKKIKHELFCALNAINRLR